MAPLLGKRSSCSDDVKKIGQQTQGSLDLSITQKTEEKSSFFTKYEPNKFQKLSQKTDKNEVMDTYRINF